MDLMFEYSAHITIIFNKFQTLEHTGRKELKKKFIIIIFSNFKFKFRHLAHDILYEFSFHMKFMNLARSASYETRPFGEFHKFHMK